MLSQEEAEQLCLSAQLHGRFVHQMLLAPQYGLAHFFDLLPPEQHLTAAASLAAQTANGTNVPVELWTSIQHALAANNKRKRGPEPLALRAVVALLDSFVLIPNSVEKASASLQQGVVLYLTAREAQAKQKGNRIGVSFHTTQLKKVARANAIKFVRGLFNEVTDWYKQP
jgi:hypothetical protein